MEVNQRTMLLQRGEDEEPKYLAGRSEKAGWESELPRGEAPQRIERACPKGVCSSNRGTLIAPDPKDGGMSLKLVEIGGFEPPTSAMRAPRSPV